MSSQQQSPLVADNYHLQWNSHLTNLNLSLVSLLRNERFADVMLMSSHPNSIGCPGVPAHKIILSSCSHFFSRMLMNQPIQNNLIYVVLPPELSYRAIRTLVQYMYSGESTVPNEILSEVLRGGELLKIRGLYKNRSRNSSLRTDRSIDSPTPSTPGLHQNQFNNNNRTSTPFIPKESPVIVKYPQTYLKKSNSSQVPLPIIEKGLISVKKDIAIDPDGSSFNKQKTTSCPVPHPIIEKEGLISIKKDIAVDPDKVTSSEFIEPADQPLSSSSSSSDLNENSTDICSSSNAQNFVVADNNNQDLISISDKTLKDSSGIVLKKLDPQPSSSNKTKEIQIDKNTRTTSNEQPSTSVGVKRKLDVSTTSSRSSTGSSSSSSSEENQQTLLQIKDEPLDWPLENIESHSKNLPIIKTRNEIKTENDDDDNDSADKDDSSDLNKKHDIADIDLNFENEDDDEHHNNKDNKNYTPLDCDVCNIKFKLAKDWVQHIETHLEQPKKKLKKKPKPTDAKHATLTCDVCFTLYESPAEWVRHMQNEHTENELAAVNNKHGARDSPPAPVKNKQNTPASIFEGYLNKSCNICDETFPTYASMVIHRRTHSEIN